MFRIFQKARPIVGEQTGQRFALQPLMGLQRVAYNGAGGFTNHRTMAATSPAGIVPGQSLKKNDPTVTGNNAGALGVNPLEKDTIARSVYGDISSI